MTRRTFLAHAAPLVAAATSAPVVSALNLTSLTESEAILSWRTNIPGDTQLEYEPVLEYGVLKGGDYETIMLGPELHYRHQAGDAAPATQHEVRLTNLKPGAGYYVRVRSAAGGRNGPWKTWLFTTRVEIPAVPPSGAPLKDFLIARSEKLAAGQRAERAKIRTIADLRTYQDRIRATFLQELGGLPGRTPLNARVIRVINRGDYTIENIVFESFPNFFVPGNLYVPSGRRGRCPGILGLSGHHWAGKSLPQLNQMNSVNLVRKGYVVLQIDPPGQNEMGWDGSPNFDHHFNPHGNAHSLMQFNAMLVGQSITRYFLWDAIRAIDYLSARPEVDAGQIGVFGSSGGGSQTMYVAALDERVKVAVPIHIVADTVEVMKGPFAGHTRRAGISTLDEESHPHNLLARGLSYTSMLFLIAPRPLVLVGGTRDLQPLWTTQLVYDELKALYERLGVAERLSFGTTDGFHCQHSIRQFPYWAFNREFGKEEAGIAETGQDLMPSSWNRETRGSQPTPLNVGATASMVNDFGSATIATKVRETSVTLAGRRLTPQKAGGWDGYRTATRKRIREILGLPAASPRVSVRENRGAASELGDVQHLVYEVDAGVPVSADLWIPRAPSSHRAVLYLREDPKVGAAEISSLVMRGHAVLAPVVRGLGEMAPGETGVVFGISNSHARRSHESVAIGRPLFGQRVLDALGGLDLLTHRPGAKDEVIVVGDGPGSLWALYCAVLDPRVSAVALRNCLSTYSRMIENPLPAWVQNDREDSIVVPGVLKYFDLPDLTALVAPRPLRISGLVDASNRRLSLAEIARDYVPARKRYRDLAMDARMVVAETDDLSHWAATVSE